MTKPSPSRGSAKPKRAGPGARTRPAPAIARTPTEAAGSFALVDEVYSQIREAIREGVLKPGMRLVERNIAAELGVSRTPVREALRLLEAHGLASTKGGRGLAVTSLSSSEIAQLYFAWENLEGLAASTAAQNATGLEIDAIVQLHESWDENGSPKSLGRLNKRLHQAIHVATHNDFLIRALGTIDDSVSLLGFSTYSLPGRGREVKAEHAAIVEAIAARDPEAAAAAARRHIRRAGQLRLSNAPGGVSDTPALAPRLRRRVGAS